MLRILSAIAIFISLNGFSQTDKNRVTIIFASDMPLIGQYNQGGYARLATAVKHYRDLRPGVFFLFGGNSLGPSPLSTFDSGSHIIDLLNSIEPDAMGVTKREYSYFEEQLSLQAYEAAFPLIATNVFDPIQNTLQDGLAKSKLIIKNGVKLGLIAVVDPNAKMQYLLQRVELQDVTSSIVTEAAALRQRGADIIVVMHGALFNELDALLADGTIDISLVKDPFAPESYRLSTEVIKGKVLINQENDIAIIDILKQPTGWSIQWQTESLSQYAEDHKIAILRNDYVRRLDRLMKLAIGSVEYPFDTHRQQLRSEENAFANLIVDAMLDYTKADMGIINGGMIRGDKSYLSGDDFTREDLAQELPYGTNLVVLAMQGKDIRQSLELSLDEFDLFKGKFPQLGKLKMTFDSSLPVGQRVVDIQVDGAKLEALKIYTLVTTEYLFQGGDGYTLFKDATRVTDSNKPPITIKDVVLNSIIRKRNLSTQIQKRIINLANPKDSLQTSSKGEHQVAN
ncbi:5'-nucleotidase C-terminal domain-containing protein [Aliiglaciecola sp. LCG003]|uniref:bifunctional metallophosphatase/5'-nucleotidase n=1 Tax=Aliiglaciecola sp. LCG003 TaxID=3053655 RepID=UPI00257346EC|nr:5'-nucleotidase C-terminal domain-containing protein [Aliiglaciecola sp. LCG003]WJG10078.1 5'-nucleotidase C-terminal domain-containing protein [Aliiglaciecola sp. LCG003]